MSPAGPQRITAPTALRVEGTGAWIAVVLDSLGRALDRDDGVIAPGSGPRWDGAVVRTAEAIEVACANLPPQAARIVCIATGEGAVALRWSAEAPAGEVSGGPIEAASGEAREILRAERRGRTWVLSAREEALGPLASVLTRFGATALSTEGAGGTTRTPAAPPRSATPLPRATEPPAARPAPTAPANAAVPPPRPPAPARPPAPKPPPAKPKPPRAPSSPLPELRALEELAAALRDGHQLHLTGERRREALELRHTQAMEASAARRTQEHAAADALAAHARSAASDGFAQVERLVPGTAERLAGHDIAAAPTATASASDVDRALRAMVGDATTLDRHLGRAAGRSVIGDAVANTLNID